MAKNERCPTCGEPVESIFDHVDRDLACNPVPEYQANKTLLDAAPELLSVCKAQHEAIDRLFARMIILDPNFLPSKSGQPWEAALAAHALIAKVEGR